MLTYDLLGRRDIGSTAKNLFGVLVHRIGENCECWPSVRQLAEDLGRSTNSVERAIRELERAELIQVIRPTERGGHSTYRLTGAGAKCIRNGDTKCIHNGDAPENVVSPKRIHPVSEVETQSVSETDTKVEQDNRPNQSQCNTLFADAAPIDTKKVRKARADTFPAATVEALYEAYPRHVGKAVALKAIRKALATVADRAGPDVPADWLMARVVLYAAARRGQDQQFTPHPATWFNQGRYDDDPATWQAQRKGWDNSPLQEIIKVRELA
jgi:DNA-binding MarR family transcriptional regulator